MTDTQQAIHEITGAIMDGVAGNSVDTLRGFADAVETLAEAHNDLQDAQRDYDEALCALDALVRQVVDAPALQLAPEQPREEKATLGKLRRWLRTKGQPVPTGRGARDRAAYMRLMYQTDICRYLRKLNAGDYDPLDWAGIHDTHGMVVAEPTLSPTDLIDDADGVALPIAEDVAEAQAGVPQRADDGGTTCPDCGILIEDCTCVSY